MGHCRPAGTMRAKPARSWAKLKNNIRNFNVSFAIRVQEQSNKCRFKYGNIPRRILLIPVVHMRPGYGPQSFRQNDDNVIGPVLARFRDAVTTAATGKRRVCDSGPPSRAMWGAANVRGILVCIYQTNCSLSDANDSVDRH